MKIVALAAIAFAAFAATIPALMFSLPEKSYTGPLPPLSAEETRIAANLRRHVTAIASREHNLYTPAALEAAARYIETELVELGYTPQAHPYEAGGERVRNIEVRLEGAGREAYVIGAHYDSVMARRVRTTTAPVWPQRSSLRGSRAAVHAHARSISSGS